MKTKISIFYLAVAILFASCIRKPDLIVQSITVNPNWASGTHTVDVTIKNIGNADATEFLVYVEGHNNSTTYGQIVSQGSKQYGSLSAGAMDVIHIDFDAIGPVQGASLNDIIKVVAIADSKVMVEESNETNNSNSVNVP